MIEIPLTKGWVAVVDEIDSDLLDMNWTAHSGGYAYRMPHYNVSIMMHRYIMERMIERPLIKGEYVDHINRDRLDNQRCNLRVATNRQNATNSKLRCDSSTGYRGVYFYKNRNKPWNAHIKAEGKNKSLGYYFTAEEAALAYNDAALLHYGEFATLNVITE